MVVHRSSEGWYDKEKKRGGERVNMRLRCCPVYRELWLLVCVCVLGELKRGGHNGLCCLEGVGDGKHRK